MKTPTTLYWQGNKVIDYDLNQAILVHNKSHVLNTIVEFVPFHRNSSVKILDIGAGQGALSELILNHYLECEIILYDTSSEMLEVAKQRLHTYRDRLKFILNVFNSFKPLSTIDTTVDVIVSSFALHYLLPKLRSSFFEACFNKLRHSGCLINATSFKAENEAVETIYDYKKYKSRHDRIQELKGIQVDLQEVISQSQTESAKSGTRKFTIQQQVDILRDVGFSTVDIVWKDMATAIIVAYKE